MKVKVVTICGSMRFAKEMQELARELELQNSYCVIQPCYGIINIIPIEEQQIIFDKLHKIKIDLSDAIFVVNIGGYIGSATKSEIQYAKQTGKEILYLENII